MAQRSLEELLAADKAGELDIEKLSAEEQELILSGTPVEEEETEPVEEETDETETEEEGSGDPEESDEEEGSEEEPETDEQGTEEEKPQRPKRKNTLANLKKDLRERSNELNTYKQKFEALQRKIEAGELAPKKREIDKAKLWDDDTMSERMRKLEEMEAKFQAIEQREQELATQQAMDKVFREIEDFQGKFAHLKTDTDIREINNVYVELAKDGKNPSDKDLLEAGIKTRDVQKYLKLLEIDQHKRTNGLRSFKAAYYDSGVADEFVAPTDPAEEVKRNKTQESYKKAESRPKVLKGGYQSNGGVEGWDEAKMSQWLQKHPDVTAFSAKEKEIFNTIYSRLGLA